MMLTWEDGMHTLVLLNRWTWLCRALCPSWNSLSWRPAYLMAQEITPLCGDRTDTWAELDTLILLWSSEFLGEPGSIQGHLSSWPHVVLWLAASIPLGTVTPSILAQNDWIGIVLGFGVVFVLYWDLIHLLKRYASGWEAVLCCAAGDITCTRREAVSLQPVFL